MQPVPVVVSVNGQVVYSFDYSQPIGAQGTPVPPDVANQAVTLFDQARSAFGRGDYGLARQLIDQALVKTPSDANLHEFRALALFAHGNYEEAASVLYAVLSVGPGWNWATLIGLYPDPNVYTQQLRELENYRTAHLNQPAARFVLAYHYITQGHDEAAIDELRAVVRNQPSDNVSAALLAQLEQKNGIVPAGAGPAAAAAPVPGANRPAPSPAQAAANALQPPGDVPQPAPAAAGRQFPFTGNWQASPNADTQITLTVQNDGSFTWEVTQKGEPKTIRGTSTLGATGLLTLAGQGDEGILVGHVTWTDDSHFNFKLSDGPPNDQGLNFKKAP
jgi:tetratricopeptide (TPR) repeat protein